MEAAGRRVKAIFSVIASPSRLEILRILNTRGALSYSELKTLAGFKSKKESGKFAYHLRKLTRHALCAHNRAEKKYVITNLGRTVLTLARQVEDQSMMEGGRLYVRTSRHRIEEFRTGRIVQSLVREAGMPVELAQKLAEEAENRLYKAQITYVTAPLIRELVNVLLLEMGYEEYRHRLTRLGLPVYDVTQLLEGAAVQGDGVDEVFDYTARHVFTEYLLLNQLPRNVADAHMAGDICISNPGTWGVKPDTLFIDLQAMEEQAPRRGMATWLPAVGNDLEGSISKLAWLAVAAVREVGRELVLEAVDEYLAPHIPASEKEAGKQLARGFEVIQAALWASRSSANVTLEVSTHQSKVLEAVLEAYHHFVENNPLPRLQIVVKAGEKDRLPASRLAEVAAEGGFVAANSGLPLSYLGVRKAVGGYAGAPQLGVLHTLAMNLPRLSYESEGDETYFRAKLALLTRPALEALDARRRHLRELAAKGLLHTLGLSPEGQALPLILNLAGLREACLFLTGGASPQQLRALEEKTMEAVAKVAREELPSEAVGIALVPDEAGQRLYSLDADKYDRKMIPPVKEVKAYSQHFSVGVEELRRREGLEEVEWLFEKLNGGMTIALNSQDGFKSGGLVDEAGKKLPAFTLRVDVQVCRGCGRKHLTPVSRCPSCRYTQFTSYATV